MFFFFLANSFILSTFQYLYPKISIIIPIYNVNIYLKECLDSIINQTLKEIEIICVNDGSTDESLKIIKQYLYDNRIIIIDKPNSGYGDSMNHGFDFASGQYFGIVESDDFVDIHMYEYLSKYTKKGKIDMIRSDYYLYWGEKKKKIQRFSYMKPFYNKMINPIENPQIFFIQPSIWSAIYKKEFLIQNHIKFLPTPGASYQDTSFFYKTLFKSKRLFYINKALYYYRQTNSNSSINDNTFKKALFVHKELFEIEKYIKKDLKLFVKNEKCFNTKKLLTLLWNFNRVDNKKEYYKILYDEIYEIIRTENYFKEYFNNFEIKFFKYLIDYKKEIAFDIYINSKIYDKNNPKISIIIPVYNTEKYLEECLNGLIYQSFKNFEIICVNDGSTDNSYKILKSFEKIDERIYIFSQINKGPGIARNIGIKESKGEYLLFLDSDDVFINTMIEDMYVNIKNNDSDIVVCNSNNFVKNGNEKIFYKANYVFLDDKIMNKTFQSMDVKKDFFNLFIWWPWDKLFNKKFIKNLGIEYQNLKSSEDLFFIASAVISAKKIFFLNKILINHRIGLITSVSNNREKSWDNFYYALKKLKKFIKEKGLYKRFKRDFINYVASFSLWNLETIYGNSFCFLYSKLREHWLNEFGVSKYNKRYFYNLQIYRKIKYILKSDLKQDEYEEKENNKIFDKIKMKKIYCRKIIIPFFNIKNKFKLKTLYYIFKLLNIIY